MNSHVCYVTKPAINISHLNSHHYPRVPSLVHLICIKFCLGKKKKGIVSVLQFSVGSSHCSQFRMHSMTSFFIPSYNRATFAIISTAVLECFLYSSTAVYWMFEEKQILKLKLVLFPSQQGLEEYESRFQTR